MVEEKKCTRCGAEHEESGAYCVDCKDYMRGANKLRNERFSRAYKAPLNSVYAFYDGDECAYIGSSSEPSKRIYEHYNDMHKTFAPDVNGLRRQLKYSWKILYTGDDYSHMEKVLVRTMNPKLNKIKYKNYGL